jgi:hypothetical protein
MALVAAVFGFADFFGSGRIRELNDAWLHMGGNLLAVVLAAVNRYLRFASTDPAGVALSAERRPHLACQPGRLAGSDLAPSGKRRRDHGLRIDDARCNGSGILPPRIVASEPLGRARYASSSGCCVLRDEWRAILCAFDLLEVNDDGVRFLESG